MTRRAQIIVLLIALALRVGYVLVANDWHHPVTFEYGEIASHLLAGEGYSARPFIPIYGKALLGPVAPTAYMAPGYVVLLAGALFIFGSLGYLVLQLLQALASAVVCLVVAGVAGRVFERGAAMPAGVLAALYPMLIYYSRIMQPTVFIALAVALAVALLLRLAERPVKGLALAAGLTLGIGILLEPVMLAFLPLGLGWLAWRDGWSRSALLRVMTIGGVVCLLLAPWTVRNWLVFHRFVPVKSSLGLNLWLGNNPQATGYEFAEDGHRVLKSLSAEERGQMAGMDEVAASRHLRALALEFIRENPWRTVQLAAAKFYCFWWVSPMRRGRRVHGEYRQTYLWLRKLVLGLLLASAGAGTALARPRLAQALLPGLVCAAFSLTYALTFAAHSRFKVPLEPLLLVFSAGAISWLAAALAERTGRAARGELSGRRPPASRGRGQVG
jgi:4-amino-4-deoxy-L-arabinose transferase-like glycosyltransferase